MNLHDLHDLTKYFINLLYKTESIFPITDVVLLDQESLNWFFCLQSGIVKKKKPDKFNYENMCIIFNQSLSIDVIEFDGAVIRQIMLDDFIALVLASRPPETSKLILLNLLPKDSERFKSRYFKNLSSSSRSKSELFEHYKIVSKRLVKGRNITKQDETDDCLMPYRNKEVTSLIEDTMMQLKEIVERDSKRRISELCCEFWICNVTTSNDYKIKLRFIESLSYLPKLMMMMMIDTNNAVAAVDSNQTNDGCAGDFCDYDSDEERKLTSSQIKLKKSDNDNDDDDELIQCNNDHPSAPDGLVCIPFKMISLARQDMVKSIVSDDPLKHWSQVLLHWWNRIGRYKIFKHEVPVLDATADEADDGNHNGLIQNLYSQANVCDACFRVYSGIHRGREVMMMMMLENNATIADIGVDDNVNDAVDDAIRKKREAIASQVLLTQKLSMPKIVLDDVMLNRRLSSSSRLGLNHQSSQVRCVSRSSLESAANSLIKARCSSFVNKLSQFDFDYIGDGDEDLSHNDDDVGSCMEYSTNLKKDLQQSVAVMMERRVKLQQRKEMHDQAMMSGGNGKEDEDKFSDWLTGKDLTSTKSSVQLPQIVPRARKRRGAKKIRVNREFWDKMLHPYQRVFEQEKRNRLQAASSENETKN